MQEAEKKIESYKELFSVVRLLKGEEIEETQKQKTDGMEGVDTSCQCYSFWKKQHPCDNCISIKALHEKTQKTKLEFLDNEVYEVIAKYMEIDGEPYVMELLNRMEEETFVDSMGREKLTVYNDKLYKDALTGAYNRLYYEEDVKKRMQTSGVALIDVDDFKLYNDTYGHLTGDMALVTVANAIKKCIRKTDILVRYGGDEFILVLPDVNEDILIRKLQRVQHAIQHASVPGYSKLQLSVSIGGVVSSNESIESAVSRVDKLMYQAKTEKNMVVTEKNKVNHDGEISPLEQHGREISLVLLDIIMPGMDGFEVLSYMNRRQWIEDIPVIMISSEHTETSIRHAYELGAVDYINRPYDAKIVYQRATNTIKLYAKQRRLLSLITDQINEKEKNNQMMIRILSQIVEFRNGESGSHVLHINKLTEMLLDRLIQKTDQYQLDGQMVSMIATASSLHDIGKIGVDEKILNKPGKLTKEEFEIMKTHTVIGAAMLEHLENYQDEPMVKVAHEICRWHHERFDGNGYPDGLKADEIPISAQVVSVADVYDALVSERVYKKAFSHEKALQMILNGECGQFNPILIDCLKEISEEIKTEYHEES